MLTVPRVTEVPAVEVIVEDSKVLVARAEIKGPLAVPFIGSKAPLVFVAFDGENMANLLPQQPFEPRLGP